MQVSIRAAQAGDQTQIRSLANGERLNPIGLLWPHFLVATDQAGMVVGAAQIRNHGDGSRELGSLIVAPSFRGQGVGGRLVEALVAREQDRLFMITSLLYAPHYERWGFRPIDLGRAPSAVRRNYRLGHYGGRIMSFWERRPFNLLVILERGAGQAARAA